MALTCADLRRRIDQDEPLETIEVRQHLAGCTDCRRALERWQQVAAKLGEWRREEPPAFLHSRLMAHLPEQARDRGGRGAWRGRLVRFWWGPTLATALLVGVLVGRTPREPRPIMAPSLGAEPTPVPSAPQSTTAPPRATTPSAVTAPAPALSPRGAERPPRLVDGPGPMRGPSSPATEDRLTCALLGPDGSRAQRRVTLATAWAPPEGSAWTVVVAPSGEVRGASAAETEPVPMETLEALAALALPPGRYVLKRVR